MESFNLYNENDQYYTGKLFLKVIWNYQNLDELQFSEGIVLGEI
jgi:hypothetical protein